MRVYVCFKLLGMLLMMFSLSMLTPLIVDVVYHEYVYLAFIVAFLITVITGFALWYPFRNYHYELRTRDGFFVVTFLWVVLSMFGAIPLWLNQYTHIG
ncbi:MAG TPA: potassium transporter, partial [Coxiellaceae bacterium]|nr:potassium transporter [Coxiellaceae bacterium]